MTEPTDNATLHGVVPELATPEQRDAAMDKAFDYRGDVTIETRDGRTIEGYIFDRRKEGDDSYVRIMPADGSDRVNVRYGDIAKLSFSGRDTAAGKSWETWVKKYVEKKQRGEAANIEAESLED